MHGVSATSATSLSVMILRIASIAGAGAGCRDQAAAARGLRLPAGPRARAQDSGAHAAAGVRCCEMNAACWLGRFGKEGEASTPLAAAVDTPNERLALLPRAAQHRHLSFCPFCTCSQAGKAEEASSLLMTAYETLSEADAEALGGSAAAAELRDVTCSALALLAYALVQVGAGNGVREAAAAAELRGLTCSATLCAHAACAVVQVGVAGRASGRWRCWLWVTLSHRPAQLLPAYSRTTSPITQTGAPERALQCVAALQGLDGAHDSQVGGAE